MQICYHPHNLHLMKFKKALEILFKDIEEIENILSGLENSDPGDQLLLNLALSKLDNLKDNFRIAANGADLRNREAPSVTPGSVSADDQVIEERRETPTGITEPEKNSSENEETDRDTILEAIEQENVPEPSDQTKKRGKQKQVLSDRYQSQKFRNEKLASKQGSKKLDAKLQEQPIKDIYKSIALNERFRYIKELFHGDSTLFSDTIQYLNQVKSLDEAESYIREQFDWDPEHELVTQLYQLVGRKLKSGGHG